jgi:hypothetical protein
MTVERSRTLLGEARHAIKRSRALIDQMQKAIARTYVLLGPEEDDR